MEAGNTQLEKVIRMSLAELPTWCTSEYPTHVWVNAYGDTVETFVVEDPTVMFGTPEYTTYRDKYLNLSKRPTRMLPYQVCYYCSARKDRV